MMRWVFIGSALVSIIFLSVFYFAIQKHAHRDDPVSLLATMPARDAYDIFKKNNASVSLEEAHTNAHFFGEALFEKEGIEGFSVCDQSFGFGCYHSFIARAIGEKGEEVIPFFDAECIRVYGIQGLGCSHGIGHGVLSFYGYNPEDLQKSLDVCQSLSWHKPYGGCKDGVFMEYNLRVMEPDPRDRLRTFVEAQRHEPCASLPGTFSEACYFAQPEWWINHGGATTIDLKRIAGYCAEVKHKPSREACFRGFGYALTPRTNFEPIQGRAACEASRAPREGIVQCREGVAWALYADPQHREGAEEACRGGLSNSEERRCIEGYLFVLQ